MESEFLSWIKSRLPASPHVLVGPGDDAAVLQGTETDIVVTTDLLCDGVHFRVGQDPSCRIGRKAIAVNLSDLAAMAAMPVAAFVAVALPRDGSDLAKEITEGMLGLADEFDMALAGGDTNTWEGPLVISVTLIGRSPPQGPLLRTGAQVGDHLLVTGQFGGSRLGRQFEFQPRVSEARLLYERFQLHAGIDCSDGLSLDSWRLAEASDCGVLLDLEAIPIAPAARKLADSDSTPPLDHALGDGEDFELILAVPADDAAKMLAEQPLDVPITKIGTFVEQRGLWNDGPEGQVEMKPQGYQH
ncbi:MAG: thiamine-phosphate kinase [Planctomycetales bacterium]